MRITKEWKRVSVKEKAMKKFNWSVCVAGTARTEFAVVYNCETFEEAKIKAKEYANKNNVYVFIASNAVWGHKGEKKNGTTVDNVKKENT